MPTEPLVTVLMSVYNGERHLPDAIDSIRQQTWRDFEFLIFNDASTDATPSILADYAARDPRVRVVTNESNIGLTKSLNRGLDLAQGKYVARMDADDISLPERLAKQVAYMETHVDVGVCGTGTMISDGKSKQIFLPPTDSEEIRTQFLFVNGLAHASVIMRKSLLDACGIRYDETYRFAQDYDLWARCADSFAVTNIPELLVVYRVHDKQISSTRLADQSKCANAVRLYLIRKLGIDPTAEELLVHEQLALGHHTQSQWNHFDRIEKWLMRLYEANSGSRRYQQTSFDLLLSHHWYLTCRMSLDLGPNIVRRYRHLPFATHQWRSTLKLSLRIAQRQFSRK